MKIIIYIILFNTSFLSHSQDVIADSKPLEHSIPLDNDIPIFQKSVIENQHAKNVKIQIEDYQFEGVSVLLEGKEKSIERAWKEYLLKLNEVKLKERKGKNLFNSKKVNYWKASEVKISNVSDLTGDIITIYQREEGLTKMTVVYKLGYNTSINQLNFGPDNKRLIEYIEEFSKLNFREYYGGHIKYLNKMIKDVQRETKIESKELNHLENKYRRNYLKKDLTNDLEQENIDVQEGLVYKLQTEQNYYFTLVMQYKSQNSEIRKLGINKSISK